ncbi:fasciclin domain-containing protein [Sphingomicrobium clamense]|uniref:Fasciclin domain-containing protein n=1 Tax=Sphingomicrobium clamense TaxID=2851013 RepID=A0ABS6V463_9SPHN|nr:fasciclin domain-containing protein [Sphingomicrobium sp. B8]MBW0143873.1 fasciclin domain-containing protein [Sphingomicrobium sp. B8]
MNNFANAPLALILAAALPLAACGNEPEGDGTIETAAEDDQSLAGAIGADSTLGKAVEAAGLADVLAGPGPYTVLAPSDEAFAALPEGTLDSLLAEEGKEQLGGILTYHILPGTILGEDIANAIEMGEGSTELPTMGGATLTARMDGETVVLTDAGGNQARVTSTSDGLSNGVVHHLDAVLMPE